MEFLFGYAVMIGIGVGSLFLFSAALGKGIANTSDRAVSRALSMLQPVVASSAKKGDVLMRNTGSPAGRPIIFSVILFCVYSVAYFIANY